MRSRAGEFAGSLLIALFCLPFFWGQASIARSEVSLPLAAESTRYLARIEVHTATELQALLQRAGTLYQQQNLDADGPIVFVLHGSEARTLLRDNYQANKELVDLAARLSAFEVVAIRVCERWMGWQRLEMRELMPFVETVPNGPAEINRLLEREGHVYF